MQAFAQIDLEGKMASLIAPQQETAVAGLAQVVQAALTVLETLSTAAWAVAVAAPMQAQATPALATQVLVTGTQVQQAPASIDLVDKLVPSIALRWRTVVAGLQTQVASAALTALRNKGTAA